MGLVVLAIFILFAVLPGGLMLLGWDCIQDGSCRMSYSSRGLGALHSVRQQGFAAYLLGFGLWVIAAAAPMGIASQVTGWHNRRA